MLRHFMGILEIDLKIFFFSYLLFHHTVTQRNINLGSKWSPLICWLFLMLRLRATAFWRRVKQIFEPSVGTASDRSFVALKRSNKTTETPLSGNRSVGPTAWNMHARCAQVWTWNVYCAVHTVSFDWFQSGLEWIIYLEFCY